MDGSVSIFTSQNSICLMAHLSKQRWPAGHTVPSRIPGNPYTYELSRSVAGRIHKNISLHSSLNTPHSARSHSASSLICRTRTRITWPQKVTIKAPPVAYFINETKVNSCPDAMIKDWTIKVHTRSHTHSST